MNDKVKSSLDDLNANIKNLPDNIRNQLSGWYHTFWELYEHRCVLYVTVVNLSEYITWAKFQKSRIHFDWSEYEWWFIVQWYIHWKQISYHLPDKYWDKVLCKELEKADERDWHTSQDVIDRLLTHY